VEHAEPELERTARRARRAVWAFRLIFYPGALLVAIALIAARGANADHRALLTGRTSQGEDVTIRIDRDGQPGRVRMAFWIRCPGDWDWLPWMPYGPFHLDGDGRLRIRNSGSRWYRNRGGQTGRHTVTFDARIDDDEVHGTASAVVHFDTPGWGEYDCRSGPVTFSATKAEQP
jgi:hypothetical protein